MLEDIHYKTGSKLLRDDFSVDPKLPEEWHSTV
jgi:hypothetical protein